MSFDLVIRNGTVIDGTGRSRFRAGVGIVGDKISSIGKIKESGRSEVDAEGCIVSPGFIDGHTHMDAQIFWDGLGTCATWHGVTSLVMGNCGFTLAPGRISDRDLVIRSIERAEDMSRDDLMAGVKWEWETFSDYLDAVDRLPKGVNVSGYLGHSALRAYVMGERAFTDQASAEDLSNMCHELENGMRAGAIGFSTSITDRHITLAGDPVASRVGDWSEVRALVGVLSKLGTGIFQLNPERHDGDPEAEREFVDRLRALVLESGRTTMFTPGADLELFRGLDEIAAAGGDVFGQIHAREFQVVLGFMTKLPFDALPLWREVRSQPLDHQRVALSNSEMRSALVAEATRTTYVSGGGAEMRAPNYDEMRILDRGVPPFRTVGAVARERDRSPVDVIIDLSLQSNFELLFSQPTLNNDFHAVLSELKRPHTLIAASDSGAHVSQIVDSAIPSYLLAYWVREHEAFTWEEGVRLLTGLPGQAFGLGGRGFLREGSPADLCVFDPEKIGPSIPFAVHDLPAGGVRLVQKAKGIRATIVNGSILTRDGEHTGAFPGRLLRGSQAHSQQITDNS